MKRIALAVVLLIALIGSASMGSAASLTVRGGVIDTFTNARPCADGATATGPSTTTATQTAVRLTVPADCVGKTVQVTIVDAAGVPHSSAPTLMTTVTRDIPVAGGYTGTSNLVVRATVDGWNLATTWSYTPPLPMASCRIVATNAPCTATVTLDRRSSGFFGTFSYYDVTVSPTNQGQWEVTFNLDHPGYGSVPTRLGNSILDNDVQVTRVGAASCTTPPRLTVRPSAGSPGAFSLIVNSSNWLFPGTDLRSC
ncbi:hypothetical protein ICW40_13350 [Actinotalea ferrariae]|uniref:hypothetical protein n=1 Tax=Actinotalea ferrariae TaxID=1386098 RepID=UPI001C8C47B6|nr:hypothetical protein [Actinotalea ferrariae]MBX9245788.1 hypothetical protein [Actinotalea ferrariae]